MKSLTLAEFIKTFKRLNVWVLLFILLLFQNLPIIISLLKTSPRAADYYLPQIFTTQLSNAATPASLIGILIVILTVSSLGGEFSWGTLRTVLVRSRSREAFLWGKLVVMFAVLLGWFVALLLVSLPLGWGVMKKMDQEVSWSFVNLRGALILLEYLARAYYTVIPAVLLGAFWTVVGRSLGVGMGAALVHAMVADPLMSQLFRTLGGFWSEVSQYTLAALGRSVATLGGDVSPALLSDQWMAALVLFAYVIIISAATLAIFHRTDIRFTAT